MADRDLYLFDGFNLLHAGSWGDVRELRDVLASFVALQGARGVVVFDGSGDDGTYGLLDVRYAAHADQLLERLAAENRDRCAVTLVSSDNVVRGTAGHGVRWVSSQNFVRELEPAADAAPPPEPPRGLEGRLDDETRERLERLRRGR
jgi:predicted RNA-binding protein with PIN domain